MPLKVLVTGGGKRIGRAIALELFRKGFDVAIHCNHSWAEAQETAKACGNAPVFAANLASVDDIRHLRCAASSDCWIAW